MLVRRVRAGWVLGYRHWSVPRGQLGGGGGDGGRCLPCAVCPYPCLRCTHHHFHDRVVVVALPRSPVAAVRSRYLRVSSSWLWLRCARETSTATINVTNTYSQHRGPWVHPKFILSRSISLFSIYFSVTERTLHLLLYMVFEWRTDLGR